MKQLSLSLTAYDCLGPIRPTITFVENVQYKKAPEIPKP